MKNVQLTTRLKIHDGELNDFKARAAPCLTAVKENEIGALQYDWFFNDDQSECVIRESYKDSDSVLAHLANVGVFLGKLFEVSDLSLEVFGTPSKELKTAIEAANPIIFPFYQGL